MPPSLRAAPPDASRGLPQANAGRCGTGRGTQALISRIIVEQAKGVLAERLQISTDDAFAMLRAAARSRNWLLSDLAHDVASGSADATQLLRQAPMKRIEPR